MLFDDYFALQKQVHNYFGYKEDWKIIPLVDERESHWMLVQDIDGHGDVVYSSEPLTEEGIIEGKKIYSGNIYTQRFLAKWVYRTEDYTLVCVDTRTDDNKVLMIFTNVLEQHNDKLKKAWQEEWGCLR